MRIEPPFFYQSLHVIAVAMAKNRNPIAIFNVISNSARVHIVLPWFPEPYRGRNLPKTSDTPVSVDETTESRVVDNKLAQKKVKRRVEINGFVAKYVRLFAALPFSLESTVIFIR